MRIMEEKAATGRTVTIKPGARKRLYRLGENNAEGQPSR